jgi:hypothetical protein
LTISALNSTSNALTVLAQDYSSNIQLTTQEQLDVINGRIQSQLQQKIAALPNTADDVLAQSTQSQINRIKTQLTAINKAQSQYSANGNVLSDINTQLAALQTAITGGDSTGFDKALALAQNDVGNLLVVNPTAPFQSDQVLGLKGNGLGIKSSATYDLSTPAGQTAAQTDVGNAQALISQIFQATTSNTLVAGDVSTALSTQVNSLNQTLQQIQSNDQLQVTTQTAQLTQLATDQEHLIQLALGNTTTLSDALGSMANPPPLPGSVFDVLTNSVGATPATATTALNSSTPAILSLLA